MRAWLVTALVAACGDDTATAIDAAVHDGPVVDAAPVFAPAVCGQSLPAVTPIGTAEPVYEGGLCTNPSLPQHAVPTTGCRLDLRSLAGGDLGTCGAARAAGSLSRVDGEPIRIDGTTQLPLVVELPEGSTDLGCEELCEQGGQPSDTRFGVRILVEWPPQGGPFLAVRVDPPWLFVTANETEPSLCHNGWPNVLELGKPVACVYTYAREVDVVTTDPSPPPARLTITTDTISNEYSNCCLFPTQ